MKKIFIFKQCLMNGTVPINTQIAAFSDRRLAEKAHDAVSKGNELSDLGGYNMRVFPIEEGFVYESEKEVPILNDK